MAEPIKSSQVISDDHVDDHVDDEIRNCFMSEPPKSFFMFAGAGSGKTRSLINTLEFLSAEKSEYLAEHGKKIAIITYTNAACDEISRRLQYKPIFHVSTIHSFLWDLIKNFQVDIRRWVEESIQGEISEIQSKQSGRSATHSRDEKIQKKKERLEKIKNIKRFSYNPNGDNVGIDSLSHEEVIKIGAEFISTEETMKKILVNKYPVLLIDESQDTKKELIDRREHDYGEYYCTDTAMNAKISIERPRHPSLPTTSGQVFESPHQLQKASKASVFGAFSLQKRRKWCGSKCGSTA